MKHHVKQIVKLRSLTASQVDQTLHLQMQQMRILTHLQRVLVIDYENYEPLEQTMTWSEAKSFWSNIYDQFLEPLNS